MATAYPSFTSPPVVETVLGVTFEPLPQWSFVHYGLLWQEIQRDYPRYELQAPLAPVLESDGPSAFAPRQLRLRVEPAPQIRAWFLTDDGERLLQVQEDRFIQNWRKASPDSAYPRYERLRPAFEEEWKRYLAFLCANRVGQPRIVQAEVTYVNHIERGTLWNSFDDVGRLFAFWRSAPAQSGFLGAAESGAAHVQFVMPEGGGRLHVALQHVLRNTDGKELLQLTLTARGCPKSSSLEDLLAWFDIGREWVVRGFADVTTETAHTVWGREA